jgi:PiT family inorganic phosphate transporter
LLERRAPPTFAPDIGDCASTPASAALALEVLRVDTLTLSILTIAGAAVLAFANGANDVSKGVATLAGSGRTSYRTAIAWGTWWTLAGCLASLVISIGLVKTFTSGLVASAVLSSATFPLAIALAAAAWVLFASKTALPVSTTHALTGAIVGAALVMGGAGSVKWGALLSAIAAPLALSPLVSAAIGYGLQATARRASPACICVRQEISPVGVQPGGAMTGALAPRIVARIDGCPADHGPRLIPAAFLHWGSAAALSFARGVNDNVKIAAIAALGTTAVGGPLWTAFAATAVAMTLGGYLAGLAVTKTLGERVVKMDQDTGLAAALVAAGLVMAASFYTLPVSTTHVSTGAIVGAGLRQDRRAVDWTRVWSLIGAWVGTLPLAAALGALAAWLLG